MPESFQMGPMTFEVSAAVTAGQVLMADTSNVGKVKPATSAATLVVGVARDDAAAAGSGSSTNFASLPAKVAVFQAPYVVKVKAAADVDFGEKVIVGSTAGTVTPVGAAAAADATTVVGYCVEPGGILSGAFGRIKLV